MKNENKKNKIEEKIIEVFNILKKDENRESSEIRKLDSIFISKLKAQGEEKFAQQLENDLKNNSSRNNKKNIFSDFLLNLSIYIGGASLVIVSIVITVLLMDYSGILLPDNQEIANSSQIVLLAEKVTEDGYVSSDSSFTIAIPGKLESIPEENIQIYPKVDLDISSTYEDNKTIINVTPVKDLENGKSYNISFDGEVILNSGNKSAEPINWLVKVSPDLIISSININNYDANVPVNNEFLLYYTGDISSKEDVLNSIYFIPDVSFEIEIEKEAIRIILNEDLLFATDYKLVINEPFDVSGNLSQIIVFTTENDKNGEYLNGPKWENIHYSVLQGKSFELNIEGVVENNEGIINIYKADNLFTDENNYLADVISVENFNINLSKIESVSIGNNLHFEYKFDFVGVYILEAVYDESISKCIVFVNTNKIYLLKDSKSVYGYYGNKNLINPESAYLFIESNQQLSTTSVKIGLNGNFKTDNLGNIKYLIINKEIYKINYDENIGSNMDLYQGKLIFESYSETKSETNVFSAKTYPFYKEGEEIKFDINNLKKSTGTSEVKLIRSWVDNQLAGFFGKNTLLNEKILTNNIKKTEIIDIAKFSNSQEVYNISFPGLKYGEYDLVISVDGVEYKWTKIFTVIGNLNIEEVKLNNDFIYISSLNGEIKTVTSKGVIETISFNGDNIELQTYSNQSVELENLSKQVNQLYILLSDNNKYFIIKNEQL